MCHYARAWTRVAIRTCSACLLSSSRYQCPPSVCAVAIATVLDSISTANDLSSAPQWSYGLTSGPFLLMILPRLRTHAHTRFRFRSLTQACTSTPSPCRCVSFSASFTCVHTYVDYGKTTVVRFFHDGSFVLTLTCCATEARRSPELGYLKLPTSHLPGFEARPQPTQMSEFMAPSTYMPQPVQYLEPRPHQISTHTQPEEHGAIAQESFQPMGLSQEELRAIYEGRAQPPARVVPGQSFVEYARPHGMMSEPAVPQFTISQVPRDMGFPVRTEQVPFGMPHMAMPQVSTFPPYPRAGDSRDSRGAHLTRGALTWLCLDVQKRETEFTVA